MAQYLGFTPRRPPGTRLLLVELRPWIHLAGHIGHEGVEHTASVNIYVKNRNTLLLWGRGTEAEIIMEDQAEVVGNG